MTHLSVGTLGVGFFFGVADAKREVATPILLNAVSFAKFPTKFTLCGP